MFWKKMIPLVFCMIPLLSTGQDNFYRSKENPHYWGNRPPYPGYWQQDVHYRIQADINELNNVVEADEELTYWNNSPYTLHEVYFHLYQNAFTKGSYLDQLHKSTGHPVKEKDMGLYQKMKLGTLVENLTVDGTPVEVEIDNTIMKIKLPHPLPPGSSITFNMHFATFYDSKGFRRRMQVADAWGFKKYNGCHWYPRICVFDSKKGWDKDQHLNKELYGDFGSFDVELTFAENYVVEATGELQNANEVFPGDLRERLDIKHFKDKKWNEKPSIIIPYDSSRRKTWKYHAENVHDFAFTADPSYRLSETEWNGIKCVAIAQEPHCSKWQNASEYVKKIIRTFSTDFGIYAYPKMVAADANDGMEYPMITMDGGGDPGYRGLLVHEIGHNWFYGMIGNNETYRAALDEGFTQFLTAWGMQKIEGPNNRKNSSPDYYRNRYVYQRYISDVFRAQDASLNTHSNDFHSAIGHENGYSMVYYKTAVMLYNLQYVLGDTLFQNAMKHYVGQWKFAHPYFDDFRKSISSYVGEDMDWFFDQWLETTKHIDYKIRSVKKTKMTDKYNITLSRKGSMQMPVDLRIETKRGETRDYYIPNTYLQKETDATLLPKWYGWDKLNENYSFSVYAPGGIKRVIIDPSQRLADIDMTNNQFQPGKILPSIRFNPLGRKDNSWNHYDLYWRPDIWWNAVDGIKAGFHVEGSQMNYARNFQGSLWFNTHLLQRKPYRINPGEGQWSRYDPVDYSFSYHTPVFKTENKFSYGIGSRKIEGYHKHYAELDYQLNPKHRFGMNVNAIYRKSTYHRDYLFFPTEWASECPQTTMNAFTQLYWKNGYGTPHVRGENRILIRVPVPYSQNKRNFDYTYIELENKNHYGRKLELHTRFLARLGMGQNAPDESLLYLQGANPETWMENKYTRTHGFIPVETGGYHYNGFAQVHSGGGLNLRGYNGYYAVDENPSGEQFINYKGLSGAALNAELDFDNLIPWKPKRLRDYFHMDTYVFTDMGLIQRGVYVPFQQPIHEFIAANSWSKFRMDAGLGMALTIKKFTPFADAEPLVFRFDMPIFLNTPPYRTPYTQFRWLIGVNRSF